MAVFSKNYRIQNALNMKDMIARQTANNRLYFAFGRPSAWANEAAPPVANTSVATYYDIWNGMVGAKLLTGNDAQTVIPRRDWAANTVYFAYDDLADHNDNSQMVIVTSDWNVYKCLSNNNGANSTVMPTQVLTTSAIEELDGYIWKFMYAVSKSEQLRFTTENYIPVRTLGENNSTLQWQVQQAAVQGSIEAIKVTDAGSGYTNANNITITITGDGSGANAIARVNTVSNTVANVIITSKGSGYTYANVTIVDTGDGVNAAARIILSPPGGHGADPLRELDGHYLMLNPRLSGTESGLFPVVNDYRQVVILANPYERGTSNLAANVAYRQQMVLILSSGAADYTEDETVYQGTSLPTATFSALVDVWDAGNNTLKLVNLRGTPAADVLIGQTSGTAKFVQSITENELEPYTGDLLYIDNHTAIERAEDQIEDFKITIKY